MSDDKNKIMRNFSHVILRDASTHLPLRYDEPPNAIDVFWIGTMYEGAAGQYWGPVSVQPTLVSGRWNYKWQSGSHFNDYNVYEVYLTKPSTRPRLGIIMTTYSWSTIGGYFYFLGDIGFRVEKNGSMYGDYTLNFTIWTREPPHPNSWVDYDQGASISEPA